MALAQSSYICIITPQQGGHSELAGRHSELAGGHSELAGGHSELAGGHSELAGGQGDITSMGGGGGTYANNNYVSSLLNSRDINSSCRVNKFSPESFTATTYG